MVRKHEVVAVRDQLGRPDDSGIEIKPKEDIVILEEGPSQVFQPDASLNLLLSDGSRGLLNTNKLGPADYTNSDLKTVSNPFNIHHEHFRTTDFKNAVTTTANWDITNHKVTFAGGGTVRSTQIHKGTAIISQARFSATLVGTPTLYLSTDGTNWELVTSGTLHTFTKTGTEIYWRADGSGANELSEVQIDNYL